MPTQKIPTEALWELIRSIPDPSQEFTKTLTAFYKKFGWPHGRYGVHFEEPEANELFRSTFETVFLDNVPDFQKYNALRAMKLSVSGRGASFRTNFESLLTVILFGLTHSNGNVRMECVRILDEVRGNIWMETSDFLNTNSSKKRERLNQYYWPRFLELYEKILAMHDEYESVHREDIDLFDRSDFSECVPYSADTKNKQLKAFRMALEQYSYGRMDEKFKEFGYADRRSDAFDEPEHPNFTDSIENLGRDLAESTLRAYIDRLELPTTVEEVMVFIYGGNSDVRQANREYVNFYLSLFQERGMDVTEEWLQIFTDCWNVFPHQSLGGKSPLEMARDYRG